MSLKKIAILGSTGSIGVNALDVISQHPDQFQVVALAAGKNIAVLAEQIARFRPDLVSIQDPSDLTQLKSLLMSRDLPCPKLEAGEAGAIAVATHPAATLVISAFVGAAGLLPTLKAIEAKKDIGLANKETLVVAGELMMQKVRQHGVNLLPVDSEHSAIFQCMQGNRAEAVRRILLTASGGPFLRRPLESFNHVTIDEALAHPNWKMGPKITIDSATMMNKGLEVIEARWLFDQPVEKIDVHIHPESVIHSMVEFIDGSVMAQLGVPDMRAPIAYAMSYPERVALSVAPLDLFKQGTLTFFKPERERFPALYLSLDAAREAGTAPAILNAANEVVNEAFRNGRCTFLQIASTVARVLDSATIVPVDSLETVLAADQWARHQAAEYV